MVKEVEGVNRLTEITVKDEVLVYLEKISNSSEKITYDLVKDDNSGQIFKITLLDDVGVPKGAINLIITPLEGRSLISLSPYAPKRVSEQSLSVGTVDYLLKSAARPSSLEERPHFELTMHTAYTPNSFLKIEKEITKILETVGRSILNAQVEFNRPKNDKAFGQAGSVTLWV